MNTNPKATRILCYGDSNTWGYIPATSHERYQVDIRWPGVMQNELGIGYEVIEEGLNSRTIASNDKREGKEGRIGRDYFIPCFDTHDPIDVVIIMLGTNELKDAFDSSLQEAAKIIERDYIQVIKERKSQFRDITPAIILVSPPSLDISKEYAYKRYSLSGGKLQKLVGIYQQIAERNDCVYVDAAKITEVGEDGVHMTTYGHMQLGKILTNKIYEIFN